MKQKTFKYWSGFHNEYRYTDYEMTAKNASYQYHKTYFKKIGDKWIRQPIPDHIDLSNTDTFHYHEAKGKRHVV